MENGKRDIKLIVVDLDGTLLDDNHAMSDRNRDTLKKAMEAGVKVVLATGKTRSSAEAIIKTLKLNTPGIFSQGTILYNGDGTIRSQKTLDTDAVRRVISYAESNGFDVLIYSGNRLLAHNDHEVYSALVEYHEPQTQFVGPLVNILDDTQINKLILIGSSPRKVKALRWQLNQQVGTQVSFTYTAITSMLEVLPKGSNKAALLKLILKELDIAPEHVMALGDAENDIEMLQMVGLGVAMGNAGDSVKEAADEVTSDNGSDGVAEAIEKFVLKQDEAPEATDQEEAEEPTAEAETKPEATAEKIEESTS